MTCRRSTLLGRPSLFSLNGGSATPSLAVPFALPTKDSSPYPAAGEDLVELLRSNADLPPDASFASVPIPKRRVLFLCNGHGSMSQRMLCELQSHGHHVQILLPKNADEIERAAFGMQPDIILAPFLTKFVPQSVYKKFKTIIVHPGPLGE